VDSVRNSKKEIKSKEVSFKREESCDVIDDHSEEIKEENFNGINILSNYNLSKPTFNFHSENGYKVLLS